MIPVRIRMVAFGAFYGAGVASTPFLMLTLIRAALMEWNDHGQIQSWVWLVGALAGAVLGFYLGRPRRTRQ